MQWRNLAPAVLLTAATLAAQIPDANSAPGTMGVGQEMQADTCRRWTFFGMGDENRPGRDGTLIGRPALIGTLTTAQLDAISAGGGLLAVAGAARCEVTVAQINYRTPGAHPWQSSNASAALMIPGGAECPGPFPLLAFARATSLYKSHSNADLTDSGADLLMTFFVAQGYAVVATDYLGYALSEYPFHPYMHADSEASAVIDSIRAARHAAKALGLALNGKVMLSGYSQGGHSSMAAQRAMEREDRHEFDLVAAAHLAGPYNLSGGLIDGIAHPIVGVQEYLPFEITALQKVYGNVYRHAYDVFNPPYDGYIENLFPTLLSADTLATLLPGGTPVEAQQEMFTAAYLRDVVTDPANGVFRAAKKQDLLDWTPRAPMTLCGGLNDPTVPFLIHAQVAYDAFVRCGVRHVKLVDVDPEIQQAYGWLPPAIYYANYHGALESPFCVLAARQFFDLYK
jgi:pimeloyl-ACP methyl ester carboxylesterase